MNMTIRAVIVCTALVSGAAFADGVPLITSGPAIPAGHAIYSSRSVVGHPEFVKVHSITLNKNAFGANVLTVTIDGQEHRFVGAMVPQIPGHTDYQAWAGRESNLTQMTLSKNVKTGAILGTIYLPPTRMLEISAPAGLPVLIESDTGLAPRPQRIQTAPDPFASPASSGGR